MNPRVTIPFFDNVRLHPQWRMDSEKGMWWLTLLARRKPGVTELQARAEARTISPPVMEDLLRPGGSPTEQRKFRSQSLDAGSRRKRRWVAGETLPPVLVGVGGNLRAAAIGGVRESGEPAPGASGGAAAGDVAASCAGRGTDAAGAASTDGEPDARGCRSGAGRGVRVLGHTADRIVSQTRPRPRAGCARNGLSGGGGDRSRIAIRASRRPCKERMSSRTKF